MVDRMVSDVGEDVCEVVFRVDPVELGCSEQRVDHGSAFSSGVGACEKVVLAAERDDAQRSFGCVVVDLDGAIVEVACERGPARTKTAGLPWPAWQCLELAPDASRTWQKERC